jgi:hypothetical protein
MPCGEEDWVFKVRIVEDPFVEEDDQRAHADP